MTQQKPQRKGLVSRFPALARLARRVRQRQIPAMQQPAVTDCGAVSLAMVLAYHGKDVELRDLREVVGVDRGGSDALSLLKGGEHHGLRGRGIKIDSLADLEFLPRASVLHWEFNHWVVFDRAADGGVHIIDPAVGRRFVPMEKVGRSFTGVVLTFEPTDTFQPEKKKKKRFWRYAGQILSGTGIFPRLLVTSLLIQILGLALPFITGMLVDTVVPREDYSLLLLITIGSVGLVVFNFFTTYLRSHLLLAFQTQLDTRMTLEFLEHLVNLPYSFFQQRSAGDLMMRLGSNSTIREILMSGMLSGVLDLSMVSIYLVLLFITSPKIGGLVLVLGALQVLIFVASRRRVRDLMSQTLSEEAESQNYQVQLLAGIETLKACGAERQAVTHWSNLYVNLLNVHLERGRLDALVNALGGALQVASPVLILSLGGYLVLTGELSLGIMLALNALAAGFLGPLANVTSTAFQFETLGSYFDRINDVFDTPREQDAEDVAPADRLLGAISVERVNFRYGPTAPLVIRNVSVEIERGQFVALVGASGSGKTTLAKLLLGLYMPSSGRICYDGADLAKLEVRSVRRQVGIVLQSPYLFGSTVRENIAMADPTTPFIEITRAAKLAQMHDEILEMPMGYDTMLAEGGATISGGQSQRIALARALVQRPAVLLMDEATSDLDSVNERNIQRELADLRCTRIVIAHRLSTVVDADTILVMDEGKIAEAGTHESLLALKGKYEELVSAQIESDQKWHDSGTVA